MIRCWNEVRDYVAALTASAGPPAARTAGERRLTLVQAADYAQAYRSVQADEPESHYARKYCVQTLGDLAGREAAAVTVIGTAADAPEMQLGNGVWTAGVHLDAAGSARLITKVAASRPTHLAVQVPCISLVAWAVRNGVAVLPLFLSMPPPAALKERLRRRLLVRLLNCRAIDWVAGRSLATCVQLLRSGVKPDRVLPFDWPALMPLRNFPRRGPRPEATPLRLLYAGPLTQSGGAGDVIHAVSALFSRQKRVRLTLIGEGDAEGLRQIAALGGVPHLIEFVRPRTHAQIIAAMCSHDAVIVPSRNDVSDELPITLYQALCTRTPLLVSNLPLLTLQVRESALVFPAGDVGGIADCIERLMRSPFLYEGLSSAAARAADEYLCPLKYDQLLRAFLDAQGWNGLSARALGDPDQYCQGRWRAGLRRALGRD